MQNRLALLALQWRSLNPVTRVTKRMLIGTVGDGQPLQADIIPGAVHHQEHAIQALLLLAQQIPDGTFILTILQNGGW